MNKNIKQELKKYKVIVVDEVTGEMYIKKVSK